jgi:hypothetical protein
MWNAFKMTDESDPKKIMADLSALVSNRCVCGHARQEHHPIHNGTTGCMNEECDCLEFEGV